MRITVYIITAVLLAGCSNKDIYQGYVDADYTYMATAYSGRLHKLYVRRGQRVTKGQQLFDLENQPQISDYDQAQANLAGEQAKLKDYLSGQRATIVGGILAQREQAQADLELATNNFNRTKQLFEKGVVPRSTYDDSLAQLKTNQQRVAQFEQNLKEAELGERQFRILQQTYIVKANEAASKQAQWQLSQKSLIAPDEGIIFDTYFNEGEEVSANQPVVSILSPRYMYVVFYIPEPERAKLYLNQQIEFTCDGCSKHFIGVINYISPQAEYTPPLIYSRESRSKLVYRVQAIVSKDIAYQIHPGQPVDITLLKERQQRRVRGFDFIERMKHHTNKWIDYWKLKLKK